MASASPSFAIPSFEHATPHDPEGPAGDSEGSDDGSANGSSKKRKAAPGKGRRKIPIEFIADKAKRAITFSKRKAGIFTKARELSTLTGSSLLLLVVSSSGIVYTFTTEKFQPLVTQSAGKNLIAACLNGSVKSTETDEPLQDQTKRGGTIVLRDAFTKDGSNTGIASASSSTFPPLPTPSTSASVLPPLPPAPSDFTASTYVPSYRPEQLEKRSLDTFQGAGVYDQSLLNVPDEEEEQARNLSRLRRSLSLERRFEENTQHEVPARSLDTSSNDNSYSQGAATAPAVGPPIVSFTSMMDGWTDWNSRFNPAPSTSRDTSNARASAFHPIISNSTRAYSSPIDYSDHNTQGAADLYGPSISHDTVSHSINPGPSAFDRDPEMVEIFNPDPDSHKKHATRSSTRSQSQHPSSSSTLQLQDSDQQQRAVSASAARSGPRSLSPNLGNQYTQHYDPQRQQQQGDTYADSSQGRPVLFPNGISAHNADILANLNPPQHTQAREDGLFSLFDRMDYSSDAFKEMIQRFHQDPELKAMHDRAEKKWEEGEGARIREELMAAAKAAAGSKSSGTQ